MSRHAVNRRIVTILKLGLVAALLAFVFSNIQWRDTLTITPSDGEQEVHQARTESRWDAPEVLWRDADADVPRLVQIGSEGNFDYQVTPGLITYWGQMNVLFFGLGALCYFVTVSFSAARWWWLMRVNGLGIRLIEAQRFTWIGIFFNNVVPGQTGGDLIKALYIMKRCPGQRVPALISVVVDRVIGLASLALLGAIVVTFAYQRFQVLALGIWGVCLFVTLLGVVAFSRRVRRAIHLKTLLEKLPSRISYLLKQVDHAVHFYRAHKSGIFVWLLVGMGNHAISVLSVVCMGEALGVGMPPAEYFVLIPVINIVSALPLAPNGWGVGELLYGQLFAQYGAGAISGVPNPARVMETRGVALSVLYRIHLTLWSLLGGILALLEPDRVTRADVEREVALEEQESGVSPD